MRDFSTEYRAGHEDLLAFYATPPSAIWDEAPVAEAWPETLVESIRAYQSARGCTAAPSGSEAVIITGQQPAIFTGPLYTIFKGVTAIALAKQLEQKFGVATSPVFWVGSEDHDLDEACTTYFLNRAHEPQAVTYAPTGGVDGLPMFRVPVEDSLHAAIDEAAANTTGSEYTEDVAAFLHTSLDESDSIADWTSRLLMRLFADTPLVFFAPHLPEARRLAAPILEAEIRDPLASTTTLNEAGNALERLGFAAQVVKGATECCFFVETEGVRQKVVYEKGRFETPGDGRTYSEADLLERLATAPEEFSPNVALRCVVQQQLFPVRAYVAGPGELAYWAQLRGVFERHGLEMPVVYPRARGALTTIKLNKLLKKLGLTIGDLGQHEDALMDSAMRTVAANDGFRLVQDQRRDLEASLETLAAGLDKDAPTAAAMARSLAEDTGTKLDRIERAILNTDEAKQEATRKQLRRVCNSLAPMRKPQERVFNVFSYLFEYGWGLVPRLVEELDIESFETTEVEL